MGPFKQRLHTTAILAILSGKQSFFIDKMSKMVIGESSATNDASCDSSLYKSDGEWGLDDTSFIKKLARSKERVDLNLVNLFMI